VPVVVELICSSVSGDFAAKNELSKGLGHYLADWIHHEAMSKYSVFRISGLFFPLTFLP
jgi:hypothetical protein